MFIERGHEIALDLPVAEAMLLFTPKGEEAWVPGWEPRYIAPETGETSEEMLFVTEHGGETTFWSCLKWQPDSGQVRYLRLTPGSRVGFVDVRCLADGPGRTRVRVAYQLHALSSAGEAYLADMTESAFAEMIDGWARLIREASG